MEKKEQTAEEVQSISFWSAAWKRFKKNKMAVVGLIFVILLMLTALMAPLITPYHYSFQNYDIAFQSPSAKHIFGTDDLGRDMFSRLIYSLRNGLTVALGSQVLVLLIGIFIGSIAGFRGGVVDSLLMRIVDIMMAFPVFLFNIILVTVMGRSLFTIILAIGVTQWAGLARLVRGQIMVLKQSEYIEAARAIGAKDGHIIRKYLLPNTVGPIIVSIVFGIPLAILTESGMALIGMGLRPPMPSWGSLISDGMGMVMGFPHLLVWPSLTFALTLLSFTFLGDGLQDALNPRSDK